MLLFVGVRKALIFLLFLVIIQDSVSPPVTQKKKGNAEDNKIDNEGEEDPAGLLVEYGRYLKEVVTALESDPEFKSKLEKAEEADIRSGKIATELEHVNHHVRTKLDEIKRTELERLRHLATKEYELKQGLDTEHLKISQEHLDLNNLNTFEIEDLRKLILKTTEDLAEADRKRREEFKEYEMQKEFEKQEKLKTMDEEHKKVLLHEEEEKMKKHQDHQPLHHPGSKQQLEEVWEKQDHMENQEFNPKTFFHLHDLDGNGYWDADEVKALFLKELDKMYSAGAAEDDMRERYEEMERMREHVFKEADTNGDRLISYEEFLAQTQKPEFEKDPGWEGLDQQQVYTHEEYLEFEKKRQEEIQRLIAQGVLPPHPHGMPPPHPGYQYDVQGQHYQQQQFPGQHPSMQQGQGHPGQMHPGQIHPGQVPQYNQMHHPNAVPQGQVYPNQIQGQGYGQMPHGQVHPGQLSPQIQPGQASLQSGQIPQAQPGQVPPQAHPNQVPPQAHPNQVPPQAHPNQVPPQAHPNQVLPQAHPNQVPPQAHPNQAQSGQGQVPQQINPSQVPTHQQPIPPNQQAENLNIPKFPNHFPQPIKQIRDPIDVNKLLQNDSPQAEQIR